MSEKNVKPIKKENKGTGKLGKRVNVDKLMGKSASTGPVEFEGSKEPLDLEKDAAFMMPAVNPAFAKALYTGLGAMGAMGIGAGVNKLMSVGSNALNNSKYEANLKAAINLSPALKQYDINILREYLQMIVKASPTVASDPRLLANYLESMLDAEGHLNLSTFGELANLENTILNNEQMRSPMGNAFAAGISKGIAEGASKSLQNVGKQYFK